MTRYLRQITAVLACAFGCLAMHLEGAWAEAAPADRMAQAKASLTQRLVTWVGKLEGTGDTAETRAYTQTALAVLTTGGDPQVSERLVRKVFSVQDKDPASPAFGNIPWTFGVKSIVDANSIEFAMQPLGPMLQEFGRKLAPGFKQEVTPQIKAAFAAIRRHNVPVFYNNIFIMKSVNLILLGEAVGDSEAAEDGYRMLDQWLDYVRANGIHEFDSPTYYTVDLEGLSAGRRWASRPEAKEKFEKALNLYWTDMAGCYFAPKGSLGGAHSRDYNFIRSDLPLQGFVGGFANAELPKVVDPGKAITMLTMGGEKGYEPPADILALASRAGRVEISRYGPEAGQDRYCYTTADFSISAAGGAYGPQDKMVNVELAGARDDASVIVTPDDKDSPFGARSADRSGHLKPHHVPPNVVYVQEKGALLVLMDLDPTHSKGITDLETNVLFPAKAARVLLDGREMLIDGPMKERVKVGSVLAVRDGTGGVAVRIFHADGYEQSTPEVVLQADADGLAEGVGAARLTAYYYHGAKKTLKAGNGRVGLLILADRCADDASLEALAKRAAEAKADESTAGSVWGVKAVVGDLSLEASRNLETRLPVMRKVNGVEYSPKVPLIVDGENVTERYLGK